MQSVACSSRPDDLFRALKGSPGYWVGPLLSGSELRHAQDLIRRQFLARIAELAPASLDLFAAAGLERYHLHSDHIDHATAWPRRVRLFPDDAIDFLQRSTMLQQLAETFGEATVTNEVEDGAPEIVWRIVRPGATDDVGPLHADGWFWDINGWAVPPGRKRVKVWTMVHGETGRAGLRVAPDSHLPRAWEYEVERRHGMLKPVFDEIASGIKASTVDTPVGSSVLFDYGLLHGGLVTRGEICRVSFEFTILVPAR